MTKKNKQNNSARCSTSTSTLTLTPDTQWNQEERDKKTQGTLGNFPFSKRLHSPVPLVNFTVKNRRFILTLSRSGVDIFGLRGFWDGTAPPMEMCFGIRQMSIPDPFYVFMFSVCSGSKTGSAISTRLHFSSAMINMNAEKNTQIFEQINAA